MGKLSIASLIIARRLLVLVTASMGLYLVLADSGLAQSITLGTLKGTYVIAEAGYIVDNSGNLIPITVAGNETYLGNGTLRGVTTFAIKGQPAQSRITFTGTYTVNADGSVSEIDTNAQGLVLHFDDYPTLDGNTIATIQTDAGVFISGVFTRSSGKALLNP